ncbi:hypothetical protein [Gordonia sp. (in: high G+C Gram-positive bacteria)]|uniref:hypothetical protein n=1 Tax=Gordonia sp. (in: high G+C Gram-positive bacteria) TaxID=84139 RepID=UPI003340B01D
MKAHKLVRRAASAACIAVALMCVGATAQASAELDPVDVEHVEDLIDMSDLEVIDGMEVFTNGSPMGFASSDDEYQCVFGQQNPNNNYVLDPSYCVIRTPSDFTAPDDRYCDPSAAANDVLVWTSDSPILCAGDTAPASSPPVYADGQWTAGNRALPVGYAINIGMWRCGSRTNGITCYEPSTHSGFWIHNGTFESWKVL